MQYETPNVFNSQKHSREELLTGEFNTPDYLMVCSLSVEQEKVATPSQLNLSTTHCLSTGFALSNYSTWTVFPKIRLYIFPT